MATYEPRLIKRRARRTKAAIEELRAGLYEIVAAQHPATVRGIFYQAVARGLVAKTEREYKRTVVRLLGAMRRTGELPFAWLADETRWMRKPASFASLADMLEESTRFYRRALWDAQDSYVEIWLEKDALAGAVLEVTSTWDVPLMVTRGYPSLTFIHGAAEEMAAQEKPAFVYYLGDHDPSGLDISRVVERELRAMAIGVEVEFTRLAVTPAQIEAYDLPTRPTKPSDTRADAFRGDSVEVDAIPAPELRELISEAITSHIDPTDLKRLLDLQAAERDTLAGIAATIRATTTP